jgi:hypothetical protein
VSNFFALLSKPETWRRILYVVGGASLIFAGLQMITGDAALGLSGLAGKARKKARQAATDVGRRQDPDADDQADDAADDAPEINPTAIPTGVPA